MMGCKDQTIPIIAKVLSGVDLKVQIYSTNGAGLTKARQMVIDKSCGYLVVYIDGDMVFSKDFIQKQVELMENNPAIGAAQGTMKARKKLRAPSLNWKIYHFQALMKAAFIGIGEGTLGR